MFARPEARHSFGSMGNEVSKETEPRPDRTEGHLTRERASSTAGAGHRERSPHFHQRKRSNDYASKFARSPQHLRRKRYSQDDFQQGDHYSPPRRSISPPPTRRQGALDRLQEREAARCTSREGVPHYSSPASPEHPRYTQHPRSPIQQKSSPVARRISSNFQRDSVEDLHIPNPVWKASDHSKNEATKKINYNGLSGVPTGPKQAPSRLPVSEPDDPETIAAAEKSPHLFLPKSCLPVLLTTVKHLAGLLRVKMPSLCRCQSGWRIVFEDSTFGLSELDRCYDEFNGQMLFSQYPLNMQRFPDGIHMSHLAEGDYDDRSSRPNGPTTVVQERAEATTLLTANGTLPTEASSLNKAAAEVTSARSSPLVARADKDDSSSISALTSSDFSGSKISKCHVCKARPLSGSEPLIHCTTCPRKYHRHCHSMSQVPKDADDMGLWQCKRCVDIHVQPKSRLSSSLLPATSPVLSAAQVEQHTDEPVGCGHDEVDQISPKETSTHLTSTTKTAQETPVLSDLTPSTIPNLLSETDADDLVEKSFAQDARNGQQPKKPPGRLNLVRKKVSPAKYASGEAEAPISLRSEVASGANERAQGDKRKRNEDDDTPRKRQAHEGSGAEAGRNFLPKSTDSLVDLAPTQPPANPGHTDETEKTLARKQVRPPIKGKFKPIPPHLRPAPFENSSEPKGKTHKWSGGGAEKDIIENGLKSLFGNPNDQSEEQQQNSRASPAAEKTILADTSEPTPKATATAMPSRELLAGERSESPASADTRSEGTAAAGQAQSLRPVARPNGLNNRVKTGQCGKCLEDFPLNPSRTNVHCFKCRRVMQQRSARQGPDANSTSSTPQGTPPLRAKTAEAPSPTTYEVNKEGSFDQEDGDASETRNGAHQSESVNGAPTSSSGKIKKIDQRTACESCRTAHKRCPHDQASVSARDVSPSTLYETDVYAVKQTPTKTSGEPSKRTKDLAADEFDSSDEDEVNTSSISIPKRKSYRTVPKDEFDLGDGFLRPKGTYEKLIGMALCSAKGYRMTSNEVVQWIADNIPGYQFGPGQKWDASIRATIVLKKERSLDNPNRAKVPLWYATPIDATKKTKGSVVELLPKMRRTMLQWDPVLKQPVSPVKLDRHKKDKAACKNAEERSSQTGQPVRKHPGGARRTKKAERLATTTEDMRPDQLDEPRVSDLELPRLSSSDVDMDDITEEAEAALEQSPGNHRNTEKPETSEVEPLPPRKHSYPADSSEGDEPIMTTRKRLSAAFGIHSNGDLGPPETSIPHTPNESDKALHSPHSSKGMSEDLHPRKSAPLKRPSHLKSAIDADTEQPAKAKSPLNGHAERDSRDDDYSALSLFDEWPEYDPSRKPFDKSAKLAEIKARPTRKQRFRAPLSKDPRTGQRLAYPSPAPTDESRQSSAIFDRSTRSPNKTQRIFDDFQQDLTEDRVQVCDTWEEFFDMPSNPIPFIAADGQLAYRDGTRNDDGTLPRAKVTFKTGYA